MQQPSICCPSAAPREAPFMTAKTSRTPTASRVVLTDKLLLKLAKRSAEKGKRYDVMDSIVPPFGIRVTDKGHLSYILAARFPGSPHYTRKEIAAVGALTLANARDKARDWIELIRQGK